MSRPPPFGSARTRPDLPDPLIPACAALCFRRDAPFALPEEVMALLQWNTQYSVGIKQIDDQHQTWISLINALNDAMEKGEGQQAVARVYKQMMDYTRTHFSTEEKLMVECGYPAFAAHKMLHDSFVRDLESRKDLAGGGSTKAALDAMRTLREWLIGHIQKEDKAYAPHLKRQLTSTGA
jgi:hemerythrin